MMYDSSLIDLIRLGEQKKQCEIPSFATQIASMTFSVVRKNMSVQEIKGVISCVEYLLKTLTWREKFFGIPFLWRSYSSTLFLTNDYYKLMSESIVATVLQYCYCSVESSAFLSEELLSDLINGIEIACIRATRQDCIHYDDDVQLLDRAEFARFISKQ